MITEPTVFVLGAGASKPYEYPTGSDLRKGILEYFESDFNRVFPGDDIIPKWGVHVSHARDEVGRFLKTFAGSTGATLPSIDIFLARQSKDEWFNRLGRLAIILRILTAEGGHAQRERSRERAMGEETWCDFLLGKLWDGLITPEHFKSRFHENKNVTIITFNYDRLLEYFLFNSLDKNFCGNGSGTVKEQLGHIKIVHVFGQIAPLPWQDPEAGIEYGPKIGCVDVLRLSENLKIIYDGYKNPELEKAREKIAEASRIFFLGFGYAQENLKILDLPKVKEPSVTRIWGTHLGATMKQCNDITQQLMSVTGLGKAMVKLDNDCNCLRLLREYF